MTIAAVIAILLTAAVAPVAASRLGGRSGWLLALVPAICFALFLGRAGQVAHPAGHAETPVAEADDHAAGHADADAASGSEVGNLATGLIDEIPWITPEALGFRVDLAMRLDGLSLLFALLVTGIGALVLVYAGGYLNGDERQPRFLGVLLAFMASMLGLVLSDDVVTMFVFWESTSITSYLLIGFDKHRPAARRAAMQALVVTGSGGLAMLAGLMLLGSAAGTFRISELIEQREVLQQSPLLLPAMVLVLAGCFTKSAQFPFHFWLPNAMEAPTPVSSYLHSATMVKAGVYLIARLNPVFAGGEGVWETALVAFGGVTAVLAAFLALRQYALKKLLAYSTTASLSLMIMAIGLGSEAAAVAAMTFLLAHALYKCCLFQTAGNITHGTGEKDVKTLGGLRSAMPMVALGGMLGGLGMMGIPPFMGYLGKETVIAAAWKWPGLAVATTAAAMFAGAAFVMIGGATAVLPFLGPRKPTHHEPHDAPPSLWLGPVLLGALGVVLGVAVFLGDPASTFLIGPAAASVRGSEVHAHLAFWHGIGYVPMWLDVAVLALGGVLLWRRTAIERALASADSVLALGPDRWFDGLIAGVRGLSAWLTGRLQSGSLHWYLAIVVLFTTAVVGWEAFLGAEEFPQVASRKDLSLPQPHEFITAACIILGCYVVVRTRSRLSAIGGMGLIGYGVALMFVYFGAPDLAITQFLIETLSVLLLVLVFWKLPAFRRFSSTGGRLRDGVIASAFGVLMAGLVLVASQSEIGDREVRDYYAATSYEEAHGRNVVNVILVDFRGVDTMGEITVLMIAAVGVFALIRLPGDARRRAAEDGGTDGPGDSDAAGAAGGEAT